MPKQTITPLATILSELESISNTPIGTTDTGVVRRNRHRLPSDALREGLQARNEQTEREGGYDPQRKPWDYFLSDRDLTRTLAQFDRSFAHDLTASRSGRHIPVSIVHAYAHLLGWRVIPGVVWACDVAGEPDRAIAFSRACRDWSRNCDSAYRQVAQAGDSRREREAKARLFRPLAAEIRHRIADTIEALRGHPTLANAYFAAPDKVRQVGFEVGLATQPRRA